MYSSAIALSEVNKTGTIKCVALVIGTKRAAFTSSRPMSLGDVPDLSDEAVSALLKELEIEQRIVEAARRMAELPSGSKRERVKRKQSLQKWGYYIVQQERKILHC